jgi:hypothetical protein
MKDMDKIGTRDLLHTTIEMIVPIITLDMIIAVLLMVVVIRSLIMITGVLQEITEILQEIIGVLPDRINPNRILNPKDTEVTENGYVMVKRKTPQSIPINQSIQI